MDPWVQGKIPWRRKWQPPSVSLPGKSHEERGPGVTVQMVTESDTAEHVHVETKDYPLESHYFYPIPCYQH